MRELRIVLTPFCNYRCFFCHSENICEKMSFLLRPRDYEFMARTTKEYLGWETATITGGEPLISPIFSDVCKRLREIGLSTTVVTNASLLARPGETLKDVSQINVSLHTMSPSVYKQITQVDYPLEGILSTIVSTRAQLPEIEIHLNYTVIKGLNDSEKDFKKLLSFAKKTKAVAKFIDLSTEDPTLATDADDIVGQLVRMGFEIFQETPWQGFLSRGPERAIVTKCPFNGKHTDAPARDVFVDSDGTLYTSYGGNRNVPAIDEIKGRDTRGLLKKISYLLY